MIPRASASLVQGTEVVGIVRTHHEQSCAAPRVFVSNFDQNVPYVWATLRHLYRHLRPGVRAELISRIPEGGIYENIRDQVQGWSRIGT
jgi:hypothetical protein